jgi:hypothetical protein
LVRIVVEALSSGYLSEVPGRWQLFETHLRTAATRAALATFRQDLTRRRQQHQEAREGLGKGTGEGGREDSEAFPPLVPPTSPPLTLRELHDLASKASEVAHTLLERLLVGLPRALWQASRELGREIGSATAVVVAEEEGEIRQYLRGVGGWVMGLWEREGWEEDAWPVPEKALEERLVREERRAMEKFQAVAGPYRREGGREGQAMYETAQKDLEGQLRAKGNEERLTNREALQQRLEGSRKEAVGRYEARMEGRGPAPGTEGEGGKEGGKEGGLLPLPPGVYLPHTLQERHGRLANEAVAGFLNDTRMFEKEGSHSLHVHALKAEIQQVFQRRQARNCEEVGSFCLRVKEGLRREVEERVERLDDVFDELELEEGLRAAAMAGLGDKGEGGREGGGEGVKVGVGEAYDRLVGPGVRATEEGKKMARSLEEDVVGLQNQARGKLARKLRRVLEEPLMDVCKRIVEARCAGSAYASVRGFRRDVHRECGHFVRKHDVGGKLSARMVQQVIDQFIDMELGACLETVGKEERRLRFWRKVTWGVGGALALLAYMKYQTGTVQGGGFLPRPQERERPRPPSPLPAGGKGAWRGR